MARFDTRMDIHNSSSYTYFNTAAVTTPPPASEYDGITALNGYIYVAPAYYRTPLLRYNTAGNFTDPASWEVFDGSRVDEVPASPCSGFDSLLTDGRHVFWLPTASTPVGPDCPVVLRFDSLGSFADSNSWAAYNPRGVDSLTVQSGFCTGAIAGNALFMIDGLTRAVRVDIWTP